MEYCNLSLYVLFLNIPLFTRYKQIHVRVGEVMKWVVFFSFCPSISQSYLFPNIKLVVKHWKIVIQ